MLVPFLIGCVVVVETGPSFEAQSGMPMLYQQASTLLQGPLALTDSCAGRILDIPIARHEIELAKLRRVTGRKLSGNFFEFSGTLQRREFGSGEIPAQLR